MASNNRPARVEERGGISTLTIHDGGELKSEAPEGWWGSGTMETNSGKEDSCQP